MARSNDIAYYASYNRSKIHPHKFTLLVALASICMMFVGLTSAFVVRRAAGNWLEIQFPPSFIWSTVIILASSVSMHMAVRAYKKSQKKFYIGLIILTTLLGLAFVISQYQGWLDLNQYGVLINGNPAGSFIYVITAIHVAHVIGGLAALFIASTRSLTTKNNFSKKRLLRLEITAIYWHFVDALWIYLFVFMNLLK